MVGCLTSKEPSMTLRSGISLTQIYSPTLTLWNFMMPISAWDKTAYLKLRSLQAKSHPSSPSSSISSVDQKPRTAGRQSWSVYARTRIDCSSKNEFSSSRTKCEKLTLQIEEIWGTSPHPPVPFVFASATGAGLPLSQNSNQQQHRCCWFVNRGDRDFVLVIVL